MTSGFPEIEANPAQSQQENQSYRQADGYISIRARFLANAILSTDDVASEARAERAVHAKGRGAFGTLTIIGDNSNTPRPQTYRREL